MKYIILHLVRLHDLMQYNVQISPGIKPSVQIYLPVKDICMRILVHCNFIRFQITLLIISNITKVFSSLYNILVVKLIKFSVVACSAMLKRDKATGKELLNV